MLDSRQHDHHKHQLRRQEHLDEQAPRDRGSSTKGGLDIEGTREETRHDTGGSQATQDLGDEDQHTAQQRQSSNQVESQSHLKQPFKLIISPFYVDDQVMHIPTD